MKLVTYLKGEESKSGIINHDTVYDLHTINPSIPGSLLEILKGGNEKMDLVKEVEHSIITGKIKPEGRAYSEIYPYLQAPIPQPTSCRDGYAFRQHVAAARRNRGVPMIPEFDQYPIFYFTNHNAIQGPGEIWCMPDHFQKLDFELEVAIVVGKKGRNIKASDADQYIAGYMIMNDMSARTLQMEEMLLNLGPAKGKDFSTVIGPIFVTPDELENYKVAPKTNHTGNNYNLEMKCWVNDILVSSGNMSDMDWTFAEILERCSYGVDILPGDVIGSGTVGTGCFLELNGTGLFHDKSYKPQWLQPDDVVKMEITELGTLINTIKKEPTEWSILAIKKT